MSEQTANGDLLRCSVVSVDVPFWRMVFFLIKLCVAAIPAGIVLAVTYALLALVVSALTMAVGLPLLR